MDSEGADLTNCVLGWPHWSNSWRVAYRGVVRTEDGEGSAAPGIAVEVRDAGGALVAEAVTDSAGRAGLTLPI